MRARDVMVSPVVTVQASSTIPEVARIFVERRISGAPVINDKGGVIGIVSEGDLLHRAEIGTERRRAWWLRALIGNGSLATDYIKSHSLKVADVMTHGIVSAAPDTPLHEIAMLMERNAIRRIPILENGALVGIVSRANLVQAVASIRQVSEVPLSDKAIREKLLAELTAQPWAHTGLLNITVTNGIVDLYGVTESETERKAIRTAAESMPGVSAVNDNLKVGLIQYGAY